MTNELMTNQYSPAPDAAWPTPHRNYLGLAGHLPRWGRDSLGLLQEGAQLGPVFSVRLWRDVLVGYSPEWNRLLLGGLENFRSRGSMSQLSPYLAAGVVATDAPGHRARRTLLNSAFHRQSVTPQFTDAFASVAAQNLPEGDFDAAVWSADVVRQMLTTAFLGPAFPAAVLRSFLSPLDRSLPAPLLPRPIRIRRMERALQHAFAEPDPTTLAPLFSSIPDGVEEARVAIAAAYDTTAHTLAFALWELAAHPELNRAEVIDLVIKETMRLYPAGWIGSRIAATDTEFAGRLIPAGQMVLYSPYLTHRDPDLWARPNEFTPARFGDPLPAWGYLPFAAGERTCLGAALATIMLRAALGVFNGSDLARTRQDMRPRGIVTLTPSGPIRLRRTSRRRTSSTEPN